MDVSKPYAALSSSVDADVLVELSRVLNGWSGREIAKRSGRSNTGVQHALERLVDQGLVDRMEAGNANIYSLNREHLLAPAVEHMAAAKTLLIDRLRDAAAGWAIPAVHMSMFGSAARSDGDASSDVDILVVRRKEIDEEDPDWREQIHSLGTDIRRWTGNSAGVVELGEGELPRLRKERPPVVDSVVADGIELAGTNVRLIFGPS